MNTYFVVYLIGVAISFVFIAMFSDDEPSSADFNATLIGSLLWPLMWTYALAITAGRKAGLRK